jgi:hypothetical protein
VSPAHSANASDDPILDDSGAELEIETEFRRRLIGLGRLRRAERAQALRAAREWRLSALSALREKRRRERHACFMLRRQSQMPKPS